MNFGQWIGRALGLDEGQSVVGVGRLTFQAGWAQHGWAWVALLAAAALVLAWLFYRTLQPVKRPVLRGVLASCRGLSLTLVLFALAEPYLGLTVATRIRPVLNLLFDGTDSMAIADELPAEEAARVRQAAGMPEKAADGSPATAPLSRIELVKAWLQKDHGGLLARLDQEFRLEAYLFDAPAAIRSLELAPAGANRADAQHLAEQLTTRGQVTALGAALHELERRTVAARTAGVLVVSDFNQNAGPNAVEAAGQLGAKIFTLGVGPAAALDRSIDVQAPLLAKKDERTMVVAALQQQGRSDQQATVKLWLRALEPADRAAELLPLGQKSVRLIDAVQTVEFPFTPQQTGQFELVAEVEPLPGEAVRENNRATREITVRDDFIRLMYAEYEPTWEWRFIKEVFHRDRLVGMRGFRTFLRSADPKVRQSNELFLATMSPPRAEFFANDVILLGDMPAASLSPRFCQMAEEFVGKFGGGLVVMAGPRFGPGQLAETPLAGMLPVVISPTSRLRDHEPFKLRLRPEAAQTDFMQLGDGGSGEQQKAWENLGLLPWYHPVQRVHPLALVLAEHPVDVCADGKTPQPLIALRRYGRGEVVYLAFNELWRLRRMYGEQYYRQFWGQLIHRLALSHALGNQKRFVVRTDRRRYQADEQVQVAVEAYDRDFQPLGEEALSGGVLRADLVLPEGTAGAATGAAVQPVPLTQVRPGYFEARFPVYAGGEHRVRVKDPITEDYVDTNFTVANVSIERQRAVRNITLEQSLAETTGGAAFDLATADGLVEQLRRGPRWETREVSVSLWNTWLFFAALVMLLIGEWGLRKRVSLP